MMGIHRLVVLGRFLLIPVFLSGCAAFNQTPDEVVVREPGHRLLGKPVPNQAEAKTHWQYAWLSDVAYARAVDGESKDICTATSAEKVVASHGWKRWTDFPIANGHLDNVMRESHLRAEVWESRELKQVVVAFGGTEAKSGKDWMSNFRWITFKVDDEYTLLVKSFGPAFVDEFAKRSQTEQGQWLKDAKLISTGHSLGGGLAQQFAYALPVSPGHLKVTQVYAFDPSPVTGFFSVDTATRDVNRVGLSIDRIYERGEILALLRSFTSLFVEPSAVDPTIRGVRYSLLGGINIVENHSMHNFACAMQKASGTSVSELK
ncbi:hypothetical protein NPS29_11280 [Pseudomonas putida]|uniref:lipase family protein n=1 Tax=Pseudomonas putida TaxID=303 RepID=UPI0023631FEE|nr:hypothetical protein [Pseudomonas putida]MDD1965904.1 hypothetical protein [Pseudomonas putida]